MPDGGTHVQGRHVQPSAASGRARPAGAGGGALTRRALLAGAAGALVAGGCGRQALSDLPTLVGATVSLQLCIVGGTPLGVLTGMKQFFVNAARKIAPHARVAVEVGNGTPPASWFPPPPPTALIYPQSMYVDDPSFPMPDVVVCLHDLIPGELAVRALDLAPYIGVDQGDLQGITATVVREGLAYCPQRGTLQAALPLLRVPAVAVVGGDIDALPGGRPWTTAEFESILAALHDAQVRVNAGG